MKLSTINKLAGAATLALLMAACTDGNDWSTDDTHARLFGVSDDISVATEDVTAEVTFKAVPDATDYVIELNNDSLYDELELNANGKSLVFHTGPVSSSGVKATLIGLNGETRYYLRVQSVAEGKNPSKWVYYHTGSGRYYFTTKAEQLFYELSSADISDGNLHVSWKAGEAVTALVVKKNADPVELVDSILLDDAAKAAGEYDIKGLAPTTTFTVQLYNGTICRGTLNVTTPAAMPDANFKYYLPDDVTLIDNDLLKAIADEALAEGETDPTNYSVTIGLPADAEIDVHGLSEAGDNTNLNIPDGMSITFFGLSGGERPVLKLQKNFDFAGSHAYIHFDNVIIKDDGAGYFINQSKAATVDDFTITGCEISGQPTAFFRLQQSNGVVINKLTLENSIFHDMCNGYSFIHVDAGGGAGVVKNISITNCTLYNVATGGKMFIYSKNTPMESIKIDGLTMYNSIGNNNYLIDFGSADYGPTVFTIENSLFAKTPDDATKNIRSSVAPEFYNTWTTNDFFKTLKGADALELSSEEVFEDPENGNFTLKVKTLQAGDPRWIPTEE